MSLRLQVSVEAAATPPTVWAEMTDWVGQARWIPFTTVKVVSDHDTGLGVRAAALSGFWLGRIPVGLLDNFVVTGWTPPMDGAFGELEVLHLGPFFTGEGAFRVEASGDGTRITATEVFSLPGGTPVETLVRLALPVMRRAFLVSLGTLKRIAEQSTRGGVVG
ncbi:MAG: SRPBCC family protein [Propionibacteriaceae bacterium]